jgi:hypothetical protein
MEDINIPSVEKETPKHMIKSGVMFEEKIVNILADDIVKTEEFTGLPEAHKQKIVGILTVLKDDSKRHESILQAIVNKY